GPSVSRAAKRHPPLVLALAALALCWPGAAPAQGYPARLVRYVVPFPAGASPDIVGRLIGERLTKLWGPRVLVDNRPGAGGAVGAAFVAKAPADGYTLFQCNIASSAIAESLYAKLTYDQQRDFAPLSRIGLTPNVLVVHPALPRSMKEFIAYGRANPGKLSYGTSGTGTSTQLSMERIKLTAKIDVVFVPSRGAPQALTDVMGGQIPASMQTAPSVLPAIHTARVRALGVTSRKRISQLPAVPTMDETALPGLEVYSWWGLCAPAGTPASVLDRIHTDLVAVLRMPELQQRFGELVIQIAPTSREEFAQFMRTETARWAKVIKAAGIPQE